MSTGALIYMALVLGLVWGGFVICLVQLARSRDSSAQESADREAE